MLFSGMGKETGAGGAPKQKNAASSGVILAALLVISAVTASSCDTPTSECPKHALLPIVPDEATFDAKRWGPTLQEVNARMVSYGASEYPGLNRSAYGPGLGPLDSPLRTDAFLRSCAGDRVRPEALNRLRSAMSCSRCHDGENQPRLDYPTFLRTLPAGGTLVSRYVVTYRKMPPGADLSDDEREALIACLDDEYYRGFGGQPGLLSAWLAQPDCAAAAR